MGEWRFLILIYQSVLNGVVSEFRIGLHVHLLKNPRPVGADGLVAERQQFSNLSDRPAGGYQTHYLELPIGERFVRGPACAPFNIEHQFLGESRADIPTTLDHFVDRFEQLRARAVYGAIAGGVRLESPARVLSLRMHTEDQH